MVELGGDPIRMSTYEHFKDQYDEYPVILEQLPCADADWRPLIPEWNELNIDVLGQALTEVITTDDPIQLIMDAAAKKSACHHGARRLLHMVFLSTITCHCLSDTGIVSLQCVNGNPCICPDIHEQ